MDEYVYYGELYDLYRSLLTNKQRQYFENYYFDNLSLSEMAENYEVSRNAIFKQLKITKDKLLEYEKNLKLYEKRKILWSVIEKVNNQELKKLLEEVVEYEK